MLKGINKNVLVVKTDKNSKFETVYFILKSTAYGERTDMLKEAGKIIAGSRSYGKKGYPFGKRLLIFLLGVVAGALLASAIWLIMLVWQNMY